MQNDGASDNSQGSQPLYISTRSEFENHHFHNVFVLDATIIFTNFGHDKGHHHFPVLLQTMQIKDLSILFTGKRIGEDTPGLLSSVLNSTIHKTFGKVSEINVRLFFHWKISEIAQV